jgi:hypothetical protein
VEVGGVGALVPATREEGERVREFRFLDLKSCETLDVTCSSLPIEECCAPLQDSAPK